MIAVPRMRKNEDSKATSKSNSPKITNEVNNPKKTILLKNMINKWKNEISLLSYEESLKALDLLLENLQKDTVPLEELQQYYLQGKIYLDHCDSLLNNVEQEVIELDPETIKH